MCTVRCEASRLYSVKALTSLKIEWLAIRRSSEVFYEPKTTHQKEVDRQDRWMEIIRGIECWQGRIIMMTGQHLNKALRERILLSWGCLQIHHVEIRIFRAQRFNILCEQRPIRSTRDDGNNWPNLSRGWKSHWMPFERFPRRKSFASRKISSKTIPLNRAIFVNDNTAVT